MVKAEYRRARETWLCTGCARLQRDVQSVDVHIQGSRPERIPLSFVSGVGVGIAQKAFLICLGERRIERDLMIGRLYNAGGQLIDDYVTFRGRRRVLIRGGSKSAYRYCEQC
jgi:hypothetical protein